MRGIGKGVERIHRQVRRGGVSRVPVFLRCLRPPPAAVRVFEAEVVSPCHRPMRSTREYPLSLTVVNSTCYSGEDSLPNDHGKRFCGKRS